MLVPKPKMKVQIFKVFHGIPMTGHPRYCKTYMKIRERFSWKEMEDGILKYFRECQVCQKNKNEHINHARLLQPLPIPTHKWEIISMDFITRLPKVQGKDCIYVVVDRLTKFAHFFVILARYTMVQVADLFFKEVFGLHGTPKTIISDKESKFMSLFW